MQVKPCYDASALEPLKDLTIPDDRSTTARRVLGTYLKLCVGDLLQLPVGRFSSRTFDAFADVRQIVESTLRDDGAGLVFSVVRRPTVSTLIRCLHTELLGDGHPRKLDAWLGELTALLSFELARARALPPDGVRLAEAPERLLSIGAGLALGFSAGWRVGFKPGRVVLQQGGSTVECDIDALEHGGIVPDCITVRRPYYPIVDGLLLACADNNPLSDYEVHPEKSGNQVDLGGRSPEEWTQSIAGAFELVDSHLPDLAGEIRLVMQTLVPVGSDDKTHLSASYAEAVGTAYLTLHPDPMTMTEAVVHEFSHNKINALQTLSPLLLNAFEPLFSSPIRPDARPLHGILLAVHAFVPVARLYEKMLDAEHPMSRRDGFSKRYREIVRGNHEGIMTLSTNAETTPEGRSLLDELEGWDEHFCRAVQQLPAHA